MKQQSLQKAFFSIAAIAAIFSIWSCEKSDQKDETVSVYLTYTITTDNGQEMRGTKASSAEVFDEFYQKIKSGELVAPQYNLTFTEKTTGAVYTVDGTWAGKDMVTLRTGTYKVVGTSTATGENIQDKCSLKFDDEVTVDVSSKTITLKAAYDCSLIIFSDASISKLSNFNGISSTDLFKFSSYIYAFVHTTLYAEGHKADSYLEGTHTNSTKFKIYTGNLNYEIGKFYVYNDISTAFDLEKMEEGDDERDLIPANQIWYTSKDGNIINPVSGTHFYDVNGKELTYLNEWDGEKWVMTFSGDISYWSGNWTHNYPGSITNKLETIGLPRNLDPKLLGEAGNFCYGAGGPTIKYFYGDYPGIADGGKILLVGENYSAVKGVSHIMEGVYTVPEGVTEILGYGMHMGRGIQKLILPSSISKLDVYCLEDCDSLTEIYCYAKSCPTTYSSMWTYNESKGTLHYPKDSDYSKFSLKSNWTKVADL